MAEKQIDTYSIMEYLQLEYQSDIKNEYENGRVYAMSGGTINHGIIGNNINTELNTSLRSKELDCVAINGDVRIWIEQAASFVYPDGMLVCGGIESYEKDKNSIINPMLIVGNGC